MAFYAWAPIRGGNAEKPVNFKYGDTVTRDKLGVDEENFDSLVESGAIRTYKPPKLPETWQDSPVNWLRKQAQDAEGAPPETLTEAELMELGDDN